MQDKLEKIIYNWVKDNFGESEAEDPSWSIENLAAELAKHAGDIYRAKETEYVREDVARVAQDIVGAELDEKQLDAITDDYMNSEAYCSADITSIEYYIKKELDNNKE